MAREDRPPMDPNTSEAMAEQLDFAREPVEVEFQNVKVERGQD